jgi:hypothetical protein
MAQGERRRDREAASFLGKADPVLRELLQITALSTATIEAAVSLRQPSPTLLFTPEETVRVTEALIESVGKEVGDAPAQLNVFRNIGSFAIAARPAFIRALLARDEVERAMANRQPDEPASPRPRAAIEREPS